MQGLADRVGLAEVMAGSAREWKQRLIARTLGPAGLTLDDVAAGSVRNPLAAKILFADRKFATASGKVNLITARDLPQAAIAPPELPREFPLLLMALSTEKSQSSQWSRPVAGPPVVTVHPDSAAGLRDGDAAVLSSTRGKLTVQVKLDPAQRRDVVLAAKGGHPSRGQGFNSLIEAATTDIGEGGSLYDQPVRLAPADHASALATPSVAARV
jgi:anaerobic selenocysteine-containing dehydrogenase